MCALLIFNTIITNYKYGLYFGSALKFNNNIYKGFFFN